MRTSLSDGIIKCEGIIGAVLFTQIRSASWPLTGRIGGARRPPRDSGRLGAVVALLAAELGVALVYLVAADPMDSLGDLRYITFTPRIWVCPTSMRCCG